MKPHKEPGRASFILLVAFLALFAVSLLPLGRLSGGVLRDFSLLDDVLADGYRAAAAPVADAAAAPVDSALVALQRQLEREEAESARADSLARAALPADSAGGGTEADTIILPDSLPPLIDPRRDDYVAIEDYSPDGAALARLRDAFADASARCVRLAVVGDSYIEGDIFTQDVRALLQEEYGGGGVGYVNMYSEFPGFRRSVRQSGGGWRTAVAGRKGYRRAKAWLSEQYSTPDRSGEAAVARYEGVKKVAHAASWQRSALALWAPVGASVRLRTNGGPWDVRELTASPALQVVAADSASVTSFEVSIAASDSVAALGVWLDARAGVAVDCMSSRGFSGVTLVDVSPEVCRSLADAGLGYDLVVLEFGINAMSPGQSNYASYGKLMVRAIENIRACYPDAAILLMGIGDRGEKQGSTVRSMPEAAAMVASQREAARTAGCLFWDTREAMGGDDAIVAWANASPPRANKDYIHLNHHGGAVLAGEFVKSLRHALLED